MSVIAEEISEGSSNARFVSLGPLYLRRAWTSSTNSRKQRLKLLSLIAVVSFSFYLLGLVFPQILNATCTLNVICALAGLLVFVQHAWSHSAYEMRRGLFGPASLILLSLSILSIALFGRIFSAQRDLGSISLWSVEMSFLCAVLLVSEIVHASLLRIVGNHIGFSLRRKFRATQNRVARAGKLDPLALKEGETLELQAGDLCVCDVRIQEGDVLAQQFDPRWGYETRYKAAGDTLLAGSRVQSGKAVATVVQSYQDTSFSFFVGFLKRAVLAPDATINENARYETLGNIVLVFLAGSAGVFWQRHGFAWPEALFVSGSCLLVLLLSPSLLLHSLLDKLALTALFEDGIVGAHSKDVRSFANARGVVLDFRGFSSLGRCEVKEFTLLDERLEVSGLYGALCALASKSEHEMHRALLEHVCAQQPQSQPLPVSEVRVYAQGNLSGVIGGADFSIGSEDFLLERGVQFQTGESVDVQNGEALLYVAIQEEVVARVVLAAPGILDGKDLSAWIKSRGLEIRIQSPAAIAAERDAFGKEMGLELADLVSSEDLAARIAAQGRAHEQILAATPATPDEVVRSWQGPVLSFFDPLQFDVKRSLVCILGQNLRQISRLLSVAARLRATGRTNALCAVCLGVLLLSFSAAGLLGPLGVSLSVLLFSTAAWLNALRMV